MTTELRTDLLWRTAEQVETRLHGWRLERLRDDLRGPLAVVGSGGSYSASVFWARRHEATLGVPAWALTPYELVERGVPSGTHVLLLSVSGRNHDILRAARTSLERGWVTRAVVADSAAPLCGLLRRAGSGNDALIVEPPAHRDGVVSTHGFIAYAVLAARVYDGTGPWTPVIRDARAAGELPTELDYAVCLGGGQAWPAALHLRTMCLESGRAVAYADDPRSFAHGGFMALAAARRAAVFSFETAGQSDYLDRFLANMPDEVPVVRFRTRAEGARGALELVARGILSFGEMVGGEAPGPEDVPDWARTLHYLAQ